MTDLRVAWILGSGFSKPLGGPLLTDLFSMPLEARLHAALPNVSGTPDWREAFAKRIKTLRAIYTGGLEESRTDTRFRQGPWANAEEFLEYVDMAASHDLSAREIIQKAIGAADRDYDANDFSQLATDVRAYLAAACHFFVPKQSVIDSSERWRPYRRWGKLIEQHDHVVTFNYDLVPERSTTTLTPFARESHTDDAGNWVEPAMTGGSLLVKMHGSVSRSWTKHDDGSETPSTTDVWTAIKSDSRLEIAGPGPGKLAASTDYFQKHWRIAREIIYRSNAVVFIGYRIPETDSYACEMLTTIFRNHPDKNRLVIRLVLGPRKDESVERLTRLLRWSGCSETRIIHEPLWSQDFLAVFERSLLAEYTHASGLGR